MEDPFQNCQTFQLQLDEEPEAMCANYEALLDAIVQHIRQIWGQDDGQQNGMVEGILSLPEGAGNFIITLLPPPNWVHNDFGALRLLFSFRNLYCEGFHRNGHWHVFSDFYLKMQQRGAIAGTNVRSLGFSGNYNKLGRDFSSVSSGGEGLFKIYKGLGEFPGSSAIKLPLRLSAVSFSESIRFPIVREYIRDRMSTGVCSTEDIGWLSFHFRRWSTYCDKIRGGRDAFEAFPGIDNFDQLLALVSMIL